MANSKPAVFDVVTLKNDDIEFDMPASRKMQLEKPKYQLPEETPKEMIAAYADHLLSSAYSSETVEMLVNCLMDERKVDYDSWKKYIASAPKQVIITDATLIVGDFIQACSTPAMQWSGGQDRLVLTCIVFGGRNIGDVADVQQMINFFRSMAGQYRRVPDTATLVDVAMGDGAWESKDPLYLVEFTRKLSKLLEQHGGVNAFKSLLSLIEMYRPTLDGSTREFISSSFRRKSEFSFPIEQFTLMKRLVSKAMRGCEEWTQQLHTTIMGFIDSFTNANALNPDFDANNLKLCPGGSLIDMLKGVDSALHQSLPGSRVACIFGNSVVCKKMQRAMVSPFSTPTSMRTGSIKDMSFDQDMSVACFHDSKYGITAHFNSECVVVTSHEVVATRQMVKDRTFSLSDFEQKYPEFRLKDGYAAKIINSTIGNKEPAFLVPTQYEMQRMRDQDPKPAIVSPEISAQAKLELGVRKEQQRIVLNPPRNAETMRERRPDGTICEREKGEGIHDDTGLCMDSRYPRTIADRDKMVLGLTERIYFIPRMMVPSIMERLQSTMWTWSPRTLPEEKRVILRNAIFGNSDETIPCEMNIYGINILRIKPSVGAYKTVQAERPTFGGSSQVEVCEAHMTLDETISLVTNKHECDCPSIAYRLGDIHNDDVTENLTITNEPLCIKSQFGMNRGRSSMDLVLETSAGRRGVADCLNIVVHMRGTTSKSHQYRLNCIELEMTLDKVRGDTMTDQVLEVSQALADKIVENKARSKPLHLNVVFCSFSRPSRLAAWAIFKLACYLAEHSHETTWRPVFKQVSNESSHYSFAFQMMVSAAITMPPGRGDEIKTFCGTIIKWAKFNKLMIGDMSGKFWGLRPAFDIKTLSMTTPIEKFAVSLGPESRIASTSVIRDAVAALRNNEIVALSAVQFENKYVDGFKHIVSNTILRSLRRINDERLSQKITPNVVLCGASDEVNSMVTGMVLLEQARHASKDPVRATAAEMGMESKEFAGGYGFDVHADAKYVKISQYCEWLCSKLGYPNDSRSRIISEFVKGIGAASCIDSDSAIHYIKKSGDKTTFRLPLVVSKTSNLLYEKTWPVVVSGPTVNNDYHHGLIEICCSGKTGRGYAMCVDGQRVIRTATHIFSSHITSAMLKRGEKVIEKVDVMLSYRRNVPYSSEYVTERSTVSVMLKHYDVCDVVITSKGTGITFIEQPKMNADDIIGMFTSGITTLLDYDKSTGKKVFSAVPPISTHLFCYPMMREGLSGTPIISSNGLWIGCVIGRDTDNVSVVTSCIGGWKSYMQHFGSSQVTFMSGSIVYGAMMEKEDVIRQKRVNPTYPCSLQLMNSAIESLKVPQGGIDEVHRYTVTNFLEIWDLLDEYDLKTTDDVKRIVTWSSDQVLHANKVIKRKLGEFRRKAKMDVPTGEVTAVVDIDATKAYNGGQPVLTVVAEMVANMARKAAERASTNTYQGKGTAASREASRREHVRLAQSWLDAFKETETLPYGEMQARTKASGQPIWAHVMSSLNMEKEDYLAQRIFDACDDPDLRSRMQMRFDEEVGPKNGGETKVWQMANIDVLFIIAMCVVLFVSQHIKPVAKKDRDEWKAYLAALNAWTADREDHKTNHGSYDTYDVVAPVKPDTPAWSFKDGDEKAMIEEVALALKELVKCMMTTKVVKKSVVVEQMKTRKIGEFLLECFPKNTEMAGKQYVCVFLVTLKRLSAGMSVFSNVVKAPRKLLYLKHVDLLALVSKAWKYERWEAEAGMDDEDKIDYSVMEYLAHRKLVGDEARVWTGEITGNALEVKIRDANGEVFSTGDTSSAEDKKGSDGGIKNMVRYGIDIDAGVKLIKATGFDGATLPRLAVEVLELAATFHNNFEKDGEDLFGHKNVEAFAAAMKAAITDMNARQLVNVISTVQKDMSAKGSAMESLPISPDAEKNGLMNTLTMKIAFLNEGVLNYQRSEFEAERMAQSRHQFMGPLSSLGSMGLGGSFSRFGRSGMSAD